MAQTEVKKFLEETQRQIDEEGLLGMSSIRFDKGDTPSDVLTAKQGGVAFESEVFGDKRKRFVSKALIAKELNGMNEAIKNGDFEPLVFNDSDIGKDDDDPTKGCEGCCDFKVCWPDQAAIDKTIKARKIMKRVFAQSHRVQYAESQMKKYFYQDYAVKRVKDVRHP